MKLGQKFVIGIGAGIAIGVALRDVAIGIGIGVALGLAFEQTKGRPNGRKPTL